ncbi:MAG: phospholipid carrier-dependent glycosyltransferase [Oscillospiraceae bacterium]|nr:phospholipid carrier-dependent glycosyltransferase [Oscillospiraceae bacterium]
MAEKAQNNRTGGAKEFRRDGLNNSQPLSAPLFWGRADSVFAVLLTIAVAVFSLSCLGDREAPQSGVYAEREIRGEICFSESFTLSELFFFPGIAKGELTLANESSIVAYAELDQNSSFQWKSLSSSDGVYQVKEGETLTLILSGNIRLEELSFRDASKTAYLPKTDTDELRALFDEAELVPENPTQLNGMYFDEIYHGRTAYEMLKGLEYYETVHPPLGKLLIMLGVAVFGMTPFGWRIVGAVFGVMMAPLLYAFALRLIKKREWAAFAAVLFSFDFMRFAQTRLATIDVYLVFFIMLAGFFMLCGCQKALEEGFAAATPCFAGGGAAFGLAAATKWSGVYAAAGLAIFYFGCFYARMKRLKAAGGDVKSETKAFLACGLGCYIILPLLIYLASYLPYFLKDAGFGLQGIIAHQELMYSYHSSLEAAHPFMSSWYTWPLDLRPIWYYMGTGLPAGMYASIASFGSPLLWWLGLPALLALFLSAIACRGSREGCFVLVSYLSLLLPWALIERSAFIYHYFPCVPFLALALALALSRLETGLGKDLKLLRWSLMAAAALLFAYFYPALSGLPVSRGYAASLLWLKSWGFYIL